MYAVCCRKYLTLKVIESDSRRSYIEGDIWTIRLCYKVWTPARHTIGTFYCTLSNFSCIHPADTIAADSESCVIRLLGGVSNTGWLYLDRNLRRLEVCPLLSISIRFILVTIYFDWLLLTTCTKRQGARSVLPLTSRIAPAQVAVYLFEGVICRFYFHWSERDGVL